MSCSKRRVSIERKPAFCRSRVASNELDVVPPPSGRLAASERDGLVGEIQTEEPAVRVELGEPQYDQPPPASHVEYPDAALQSIGQARYQREDVRLQDREH